MGALRQCAPGLRCALVVATLLVAPRLAVAAEDSAPDALAKADNLIREGNELGATGDLTQACAKFDAATGLDPSAKPLLFLADCEELSGKLQLARVHFKAALKLLPPDDPRFARASERLVKIELRLEKESGATPPPPEPAVDPKAIDRVGDTKPVAAVSDSKRTWGIVLVATGGASLALGGVAGVLALNAKADDRDQCGDEAAPTTDECESINRRGRTMAVLSTVGVAVGGAMAATGLYLVLSSGSTTVAMAPSVGGLRAWGTF